MSFDFEKDVEIRPSHLDLDFFQESLESALRETNCKIERVRFTMGSTTGENYLSQIYRAKVIYTDREGIHGEFPMIIKSMPTSEANRFLIDLDTFLKEKITYMVLLPRMEVFLSESQRFAPRLYNSVKLPINTLVFEDLNAKGFQMASREKGLDEGHARLVIQRLGKFHATSMVLGKKDPELFKKTFSWGMLAKNALERDKNTLLHFFGGNAEALLNLISKWPGYESITKKITRFTANLKESLWRSQAPLPGEIKVLNHGDLWVNNMLFKYDQQRNVQDVLFVDYQLSIWSSPGIDLNYFFYTSLQLELLKNKRETLLREYYQTLSHTLRELRPTEIPTYEQILQEVKNRERFGFFANIAIFPTLALDKDTASDNSLENLADEDFIRKRMEFIFQSKRVQETLRYTLKNFDELGIWD